KESSPKESALATTYVFLETLQTLFDGLQCGKCGTQCLQLNHDAKNKSGFAVLRQVFCATCSQTFGLRYRTAVSDGDSNTIKAIHKSNPYVGLNVEKHECINHVGKRLGTALRNVVDTAKKQKVTLGGNGRGKLTQTKIAVLQKYFTKALRSFTTVPEMRKAVWATFYHCTSSDESWNHSCCPEGSLSWCFFKRAEALGVPAASHEEMVSTYLSHLVAEHIKPVYERLTEDDLLRRCTEGQTQNANESAHALIWSHCPKHLFIGKQRVEMSVSVGIGEFNMGSLASKYFLDFLKLDVGIHTEKLGLKRNTMRISKAQRALDNNENL
ncbi:hypothetical protein BgiMline_031218, partial [Biomphalaria glabrata]